VGVASRRRSGTFRPLLELETPLHGGALRAGPYQLVRIPLPVPTTTHLVTDLGPIPPTAASNDRGGCSVPGYSTSFTGLPSMRASQVVVSLVVDG
jgi:hypothetical protein